MLGNRWRVGERMSQGSDWAQYGSEQPSSTLNSCPSRVTGDGLSFWI